MDDRCIERFHVFLADKTFVLFRQSIAARSFNLASARRAARWHALTAVRCGFGWPNIRCLSHRTGRTGRLISRRRITFCPYTLLYYNTEINSLFKTSEIMGIMLYLHGIVRRFSRLIRSHRRCLSHTVCIAVPASNRLCRRMTLGSTQRFAVRASSRGSS